MNRRRFLSLLGLAAPAMALDPERALWVPGEKSIFDLGASPARVIELGDQFAVEFNWTELDKAERIGANTFVSSDWVMKAITEQLTRNLRFAQNIHRSYEDQFTLEEGRVGATIRALMPARHPGGPERVLRRNPPVVLYAK